jgi:hypothetical protein
MRAVPPSLVPFFFLSAVSAFASMGCGGDDTLPTYRCVKAIDGANESGGEIASIGSTAYVAGFSTIAVFDLSNASEPKPLSPLAMPARVEALATGGGRLIAATSNTLVVFDASTPAAPTQLGRADTSTISTNALATDGHFAYAGTPNGGVLVFDISSGTASFLTQVSAGGTLAITDLVLHDKVLYVANGGATASLVPIDVSQPDRPVPQAAVDVGGNLEGLDLSDGSLWSYTFQKVTQTPTPTRIDVGSSLAPKVVASATGGCSCSAQALTVQITNAHGHFFGTTPFGNALSIWSHDLNTAPTEVGIACAPGKVHLSHVHAVGDAVITTGDSLTAFLAP